MSDGKLNWGAIVMGAALVTGIAAAMVFLPGALGLTAGGAASAIVGSVSAGGVAGTGIAGAIEAAVGWAMSNAPIMLGAGAAVGAITGALVGKGTDAVQDTASSYVGR